MTQFVDAKTPFVGETLSYNSVFLLFLVNNTTICKLTFTSIIVLLIGSRKIVLSLLYKCYVSFVLVRKLQSFYTIN